MVFQCRIDNDIDEGNDARRPLIEKIYQVMYRFCMKIIMIDDVCADSSLFLNQNDWYVIGKENL